MDCRGFRSSVKTRASVPEISVDMRVRLCHSSFHLGGLTFDGILISGAISQNLIQHVDVTSSMSLQRVLFHSALVAVCIRTKTGT